MPTFLLARNKDVIGASMLKALTPHILASGAKRLSCNHPDGALAPNEIELRVHTYGDFDVTPTDFSLVIYPNAYPERVANAQERIAAMADDIYATGILPEEVITGGRACIHAPTLGTGAFAYIGPPPVHSEALGANRKLPNTAFGLGVSLSALGSLVCGCTAFGTGMSLYLHWPTLLGSAEGAAFGLVCAIVASLLFRSPLSR